MKRQELKKDGVAVTWPVDEQGVGRTGSTSQWMHAHHAELPWGGAVGREREREVEREVEREREMERWRDCNDGFNILKKVGR